MSCNSFPRFCQYSKIPKFHETVYTHAPFTRESSKCMRSKHRLGPMYLLLVEEVHAHRRTRARAYVRDDGAACVYPRNPVTVSHTGPMYDSRGRGEGTGTRYRRNLKVKSPEMFGKETLMDETRKRTKRSKDTRASGEPLVALMQVHQDTGDPVTNSPTFCPIPTAVLLTHYKLVLRVTQISSFIHLNQLGSEYTYIYQRVLGFCVLIFGVSNLFTNFACILNFKMAKC